jgi:hypothetical protein
VAVPHMDPTSFSSENARRYPRQRIETLVYAGLGSDNGGFPINISEDGMAFQGVQPLEKNQTVHITFKLPGISESMAATAEIVWLNESQKGGGLQFIELREDSRRQIKTWLLLRQTETFGVEPPLVAPDAKSRQNAALLPVPRAVGPTDYAPEAHAPNPSTASPTSSSEPANAVTETAALDVPVRVERTYSYRAPVFLQPSPHRSFVLDGDKRVIMSFALGVIFAIMTMTICGVVLWEFRDVLLPLVAHDYLERHAIHPAGAPAPAPLPEQSAVTGPPSDQLKSEPRKNDPLKNDALKNESTSSNAVPIEQDRERTQSPPNAVKQDGTDEAINPR